MLAKMIDKIVALKETKTFEIAGQTYACLLYTSDAADEL